jgi:prophage regulatory protein
VNAPRKAGVGLASASQLDGSRGRHAREERTVAIDRTARVERLESVPLKFLRFEAVRDRTGLSRSTIWRLERRGEFPRHHRISTNAVGWLETDVNDWMLAKTATG